MPKPDAVFTLDTDLVIVAIGAGANPVVFDFAPQVQSGAELLTRRGDDERLHTDRPSVVRRREMDAEYHAAKAEAEGKPLDPKQSWRAMPDEGDAW